jgi:pyruvate dehydrogenase E2 component (dihydrolipoamide acetyltransferase)
MPTNVVMPQMGESIAEGTIVRWIKKLGDNVDRDEPLFEISTDKVDAEIPSPSAGVLTEIKVKEGETVPVNSVVAVIGGAGEKAVDLPPTAELPLKAELPPKGGHVAGTPSEMPEAAVGQPEAASTFAASAAATVDKPANATQPAASIDELRRQKSSPVVRRIAREHNVDIERIQGTGLSGRVTKDDILGFIESGKVAAPTGASSGIQGRAFDEVQGRRPAIGQIPAYRQGDKVEIVPMTIMRKKIAEHMVMSARTSPHVYSVYEVDFHRLAQLREKKKAEYERNGAKLTYTALISKVVVDALRKFPVVNASIDGDNIVYKKDINLGIAVALDQGLIVPVIRNADEKNLVGLSRAIEDLAARARSKKLNPEEVQGGTFTITNPGIFGAVYGLPLINQPQVAILGVGGIEKRAVVVNDAIAIHPTCHLSLGYDHRLVDGADAGRFLSFIKERLENFDEAWI